MKKKIIFIIAAVLLLLGIVGGVLIQNIFFREQVVEEYFTKEEAVNLLQYLAQDEEMGQALKNIYTPLESQQAFTAQNGKQVLEIFEMQWSDTETLDLNDMDEETVFSKEQFLIFYQYIVDAVPESSVLRENFLVYNIAENDEGVTVLETNAGEMQVGESTIYYQVEQLENCLDKVMAAYIVDSQIIAFLGYSDEAVTLQNVWIQSADETQLYFFYEGMEKAYPCNVEQENITNSLGDLVIQNSGITDIVLKTDIITTKVLSVQEDGIELEGYGILPKSEHYKIYKIYGALASEQTSNILMGYNTASFVVANGVIEASLITEEIKTENIRVVLGNNDFSEVVQETVKVTSDTPFTLKYGEEEIHFAAGEEVELTEESEYFNVDDKKKRVYITSDEENGKIKILSLERQYGNPAYRGTIEVALINNSLIIVNELPLEEYLYSVLPSEMPSSYGTEALKAQAICARGYAYAAIMAGTYASYGAHLDDSTMSQVYNNVEETEEAVFAVKDTYGMVPMYDGKVTASYFFSTSCGVTCNNADVWGGTTLEYLTDTIETAEPVAADLSEEAAFRNFIDTGAGYDMLEKDFPFYRWRITFTKEEISESINTNLETRIQMAPGNILVQNSRGRYVKQSITTIGEVVSIEVTQRGDSGIIKEMVITGTEATIQVTGQTNARALISPANVQIQKQDGSVAEGWSSLPSPFYYIDVNEAENTISLVGGGFGHGVGMSQNGAKALAELGYSAEDIIKHYYTDVELVNIYEDEESQGE